MSHAQKYSDEIATVLSDFQRICVLAEKEDEDAKPNQSLMVSAAKTLINLVYLVRQKQRREGGKEGILILFDCMSFAMEWQIECVRIPEGQRSDELKRCIADLEGLFPVSRPTGVYHDSLDAICQKAGLDPSLRNLLGAEDVQRLEEQLADCSDSKVCKALIHDVVFEGLADKLYTGPGCDNFNSDQWQIWLELYLGAIALLQVYPREGS